MALLDTTEAGNLALLDPTGYDGVNVLHAMTLGDEASIGFSVVQGSANGTVAVTGRVTVTDIIPGSFNTAFFRVAADATLFGNHLHGGPGSNGGDSDGNTEGTPGVNGSVGALLSPGAAIKFVYWSGGNGGNGGAAAGDLNGGDGGDGGAPATYTDYESTLYLMLVANAGSPGAEGSPGANDPEGTGLGGAGGVDTSLDHSEAWLILDSLMPCDVRSGMEITTLSSQGAAFYAGTLSATSGGEYASRNDVRFGVDRGDGQTGLCHVPTEEQTRKGVAVDVEGEGIAPRIDRVFRGVGFWPH